MDGGEILSVSGPSLTTIERQTVDDDMRWSKVTRWLKYQRALMMTTQIAAAIKSLWACGKQRHIGQGALDHVQFFDVELLEKSIILGASDGFNTETMCWTLYDIDHPMFVPMPGQG